jgi:error-prone DNA polymerase
LWLAGVFPACWIALEQHRGADDAAHARALQQLASQIDRPLVACGDVHMHVRGRRALQDVLCATRLQCTVAAAGQALFANGERHLRTPAELQQLYPADALAQTVVIAERCSFVLSELHYEYPQELVPTAHTASSWLRVLTECGIRSRWPSGISTQVRQLIEHELALISELRYEYFFLTVHDVVAFARSRGILCQGRGSAANSAVCFCLGITEVDPARMSMLFERFISRERNEPPDIDVDFEHERREEVIQYIYGKYGRRRAALAATVICYRSKSALRDVGRALGMTVDTINEITRALAWWDGVEQIGERLGEHGFDLQSPQLRRLIQLVRQLVGFPRHLSQHVGGFVISQHPLSELVPVENAAMADRTIIQWDKDDLETLGLLKVDCLALGMLTALHRCFDLVVGQGGPALSIASIPAEDPATYAMIQQADTVGVFQIESRAQMSMLPRLKPKCFYDLVIEVAIVRPGPIQGNMVHPYLKRRNGEETVEYPSPQLQAVFERTLGVPIFQEQVMQLVIVAAGFTPGEADHLRRSMAAWKRRGGLDHLQQRVLDGMLANGYEAEFALQLFEQIRGFGSYGFPESHAASFALLVYASAWLKCHYPVAFACALLNSQPMGFYSAAQIVADLRRHGGVVLPVDIQHSQWDHSLEPLPGALGQSALRLGLRQLRGLSVADAQRLLHARAQAAFIDIEDFRRRCDVSREVQLCLAQASALRSLSAHVHQAAWAVSVEAAAPQLLRSAALHDPPVSLPVPDAGQALYADYASTGLSLDSHPLALLRPRLRQAGYRDAAQLRDCPHLRIIRVAGLVTMRQRPATASGVTFVTLEDEHGLINLVIWRDLADVQRRVLLEARIMGVRGQLQRVAGVTHVLARQLHTLDDWMAPLPTRSRDFH